MNFTAVPDKWRLLRVPLFVIKTCFLQKMSPWMMSSRFLHGPLMLSLWAVFLDATMQDKSFQRSFVGSSLVRAYPAEEF